LTSDNDKRIGSGVQQRNILKLLRNVRLQDVIFFKSLGGVAFCEISARVTKDEELDAL